MPFFMVDDQFHLNHKTRALVDRMLNEQNPSFLAALGLWVLAGSQCQATGTDGVVSRADIARLLVDPTEQLARLLVDAGLWHAPGHRCPRCPVVDPGSYRFHDWDDMRYGRASQVRSKRAASKELTNQILKAEVWARDCISPEDPHRARCRYCGTVVNRADRRSARAAQIDHVVPGLAMGLVNLVVACAQCNQIKGNRTPWEAEMELKSAPRDDGMADPLRDDVRALSEGLIPTIPPDQLVTGLLAGASRAVSAGLDGAPLAPTRDAGRGAQLAPAPGLAPPGRPNLPDQLVFTVSAGTHTRVYAGQGQGQGLGRGTGLGAGPGDGQGQAQGDGQGARPGQGDGRTRRRRRGRQGRTTTPPAVRLPPGDYGSPYYRHTGGPLDTTESTCPAHGLHRPCRKCGQAAD